MTVKATRQSSGIIAGPPTNFADFIVRRSRRVHHLDQTPSIVVGNPERSKMRVTAIFTDVMMLLPVHAIQEMVISKGHTSGQGARSRLPNNAAHMQGTGGLDAPLVGNIVKYIENKGCLTPETKQVVEAMMNSPFAKMLEKSPSRAGQLFNYWATPHRHKDPHHRTYRGYWRDFTSNDPAVFNRADCIVEDRLREVIFAHVNKISHTKIKKNVSDYTTYCKIMKEFAIEAEKTIKACMEEQKAKLVKTREYIEAYNKMTKMEEDFSTIDSNEYKKLVKRFVELDFEIKSRKLSQDYDEMRKHVSVYNTNQDKENLTKKMEEYYKSKPHTRYGDAGVDLAAAQKRILDELELIHGELERQHAHISDIATHPKDIKQHFINIFGERKFGNRVKPSYPHFRSQILLMLNPKTAVKQKQRKVDALLTNPLLH